MRTPIIIFLILLSTPLFAQQDPLYSQYMLNPLLINPAYAGLNNNFNAMAGYRAQWTGLDGQPTTINASAHSSVAGNKVGVGILFINDKIGNISNTETNFSVSYKLELEESIFSFGMQAGLQSFRSDNSGLTIFDPDDNAFATNERGTRLNIGAGAILKSERFFVGLSIPRLLPSTFRNGGQEFELYNQHYYLMGSYVHYLNEHIRLKPSILLRGIKGAPPSVDLAFNLNINAIHTAGVFTRNLNTYGILLQTLVKEKLRFGYVFELPTNKSVGAQFTSHEISVGVSMSVLSFHEKSLTNF
jgi:type IX secretion system PorP/SprF family membrane protein